MPSPGHLGPHPAPTRPRTILPPLACDAHAQVMGPAERFAYAARSDYLPADAPKEALFLRHALLGFDRGVLVQAHCHGADNRAMLDALRVAGKTCRGVAILPPRAQRAELEAMHLAGVRAIRLDAAGRLHARLDAEARRGMLAAVRALGWHVEIDAGPEDLGLVETLLVEAGTRLVLTRTGRVRPGDAAGLRAVADLLARAPGLWIKLEGAAHLTEAGPPYADMLPVARTLAGVAPDRTLWGTGWPHARLTSHMPDDGVLVDTLGRLCPDAPARRRILVENPTRLYWPEMAR